MSKKSSAKSCERKAFNILKQIIRNRQIERDPRYDILKIKKEDMAKVISDARAKTIRELFSKAGDLYLEAGEPYRARQAYMSAIEMSQEDSILRDRYVRKRSDANEIFKQQESELGEKIEDVHDSVMFGRLQSKFFFFFSILALLAGILFLSFSFTGNVISNLTASLKNVIGGSLVIIGLVAGFFWVKGKNSCKLM